MKVTYKELLQSLDDHFITLDEITTQANIYLDDNNMLEAYPYVKATALSKRNSISDKMIAGILALSLNKKNDAIEMFTAIVLLDPKHFDANYNLVLFDIENKNFKNAFNKIESLLELYPDNTDLLNDIAVVATYLNKSEEAFFHWEKALQINPNDSMSRNNALAYSLEKHFYQEANQLLSVNEKSIQNNLKSKAEINRWQQIIDDEKMNYSRMNINSKSEQVEMI